MTQLMPLPLTVSCFSKIQIGFTFLVPAHPVSPEKGLLNVCVCGVFLVKVTVSHLNELELHQLVHYFFVNSAQTSMY